MRLFAFQVLMESIASLRRTYFGLSSAHFRFLLLVWSCLSITLVACANEPERAAPPATLTPFPPDLYIGLSDSAAPLADLVTAAYWVATGERAPIFLAGSDEALLSDLEQGVLEAVIVHHLPADSQFWFSPIALDGVVVMVHPDVGVDQLTISELQRILSGAVTNWGEVGGPDMAIRAFTREAGSGLRDILRARVMRSSRFSGLAQIAASDEFMQQQVATTEGAIGYSAMGSAKGETVRLDDQAATIETVTNQSYPLTAPLYFVAPEEPEGPLRDFLAWLQSAEGQDLLGEKYGRVR